MIYALLVLAVLLVGGLIYQSKKAGAAPDAPNVPNVPVQPSKP